MFFALRDIVYTQCLYVRSRCNVSNISTVITISTEKSVILNATRRKLQKLRLWAKCFFALNIFNVFSFCTLKITRKYLHLNLKTRFIIFYDYCCTRFQYTKSFKICYIYSNFINFYLCCVMSILYSFPIFFLCLLYNLVV